MENINYHIEQDPFDKGTIYLRLNKLIVKSVNYQNDVNFIESIELNNGKSVREGQVLVEHVIKEIELITSDESIIYVKLKNYKKENDLSVVAVD